MTIGGIALVQAGLLVALSVCPLGLDLAGGTSLLVLVAVLDGLLGMALGLFVSVFTRTEFQVGQLMPVRAAPIAAIRRVRPPHRHGTGATSGR